MNWNRMLPFAMALGLLVGGCGTTVVNPVTGQTERTTMDESAELTEGKKAHAEVLKEYGVYRDARLQAYVNEVGQKLAKQSHRANIPWTFTVLDSAEINAFALPGGYVYVTRGILAYMENEADMAGVIGHEIGHVTARHGAQRATRQQTAGLGVLAATVLGAVLESKVGVSGGTEMFGQMAQGMAAGYVAKYSREQELQADTLGAEYLARSQYDPRHMIDVIRVLKLQEAFAIDEARAAGQPAPERDSWLSSHPSNDQRLQSISQNAAKYQGTYASDGGQRFMQVIHGMRFGETPEQGLTRGQNFYHPAMGITMAAPAGWRIQNEPEALTFASPQGDAALRVLAVPPNAGNTHDDIIRNALQPSEGTTTRGHINGFTATHFVGARKGSNGQPQTLEATLVTGPKQNTFVMLYLAVNPAARQLAMPGMTATEKSFRAMNAADQQLARPWVVHLVPFPRGGFAELARQSAVPEKRLQLLNGTYGRSDPPVGQMVKVVKAE
ncbi:M48 family metalloprotease [Hydrogenophaga sp. A37]|uniref:M48 family metalloprotease n=1 Tax=Hydrogenophaga sp. A37 TaxID=1945864 RepID=UPI00098648F0|nr:M48 family metalloprotease [Hydrogenophaga sp. A37]OOG84984.1 peptidase [Hydrogenophaga sp. A37]